MTGDRLLEFCNNELFPQLKELSLGGNGRSRGFVVRSVFEDAYPDRYVDPRSERMWNTVMEILAESSEANDAEVAPAFEKVRPQECGGRVRTNADVICRKSKRRQKKTAAVIG